jgi:leader peptidase (prepilin peptidase)/N-methyltransferase
MIESINHIFQTINHELPWVLWGAVIAIGGVFGSFLTCMLYRVPRKISLSNPPSYCPSCKEKLKGVDLIPVLSYVIFKGKCHYCKSPVSPRYMLIELLTIITCACAYIMTGPQVALVLSLVLAISWLFAIGLWVESRMVSSKVLLFSIIVLSVMPFVWR